jgi:hypothetical protein
MIVEKKCQYSLWFYLKKAVLLKPQDKAKQIEVIPNGILILVTKKKWLSKYHIVIKRKLFAYVDKRNA